MADQNVCVWMKLNRFELQTIFDEMKIHCEENTHTLKLCGFFLGIWYGFEKQSRLFCLCRLKNKMAQMARTYQTVWVGCDLRFDVVRVTSWGHRVKKTKQNNTRKKKKPSSFLWSKSIVLMSVHVCYFE